LLALNFSENIFVKKVFEWVFKLNKIIFSIVSFEEKAVKTSLKEIRTFWDKI